MPHDPKSLVIGLDFDGTCVTHEFPKIGQDIGAVPVLKELVAAGHKLILWTMRSDREALGPFGDYSQGPKGDYLSEAVAWFQGHEIPLYGIQHNPEQDSWTRSPKAYCNIYIDDASLGAPLIYPEGGRPHIDWKAVRAHFFPERVTLMLHRNGPCMLCAGADQDSDFDYCRACGFTISPIPDPLPSPPEKGTLARAIWDARGGPPPPKPQIGFA